MVLFLYQNLWAMWDFLASLGMWNFLASILTGLNWMEDEGLFNLARHLTGLLKWLGD